MTLQDAINQNIIYEKPEGWYWVDETWSNEDGPCLTKEEAFGYVTRYIHFLNTGSTGQ